MSVPRKIQNGLSNRISLLTTIFCTFILIFLFLNQIKSQSQTALHLDKPTSSVKRAFECAKCQSKVPCEYPNEVDLRLIVITYDRVSSLRKSLDAIQAADYLGDTVAMEIWIDRSVKGEVNNDVLNYAKNFRFRHGQSCVHVQTEHGNVALQWIYSWKPKKGTKELAVFIEDDVDVSPYFYRYLKNAREFYKNNREIAGYCLNDENCQISRGPKAGRPMPRPKEKTNMVFLYGLFCTWGYAPDPEHWRNFQHWFHYNVSKNASFDPTTSEAAMQSGWYRMFKKKNKADTMLHEIYLIKYSVINKLWTLHPNLQVFEPRPNSGLTSCRKENGLHFSGKADHGNHGLKVWRDEFVKFPRNPIKMGWGGERLTK